mmetsp:Transcript_38547/g.93396  ORF Transcript_38547/g.93396 Transcript_38547/m.93396 type:complete len:89 (-) Transcript_38547:139-405(-)
MSLCHNTRNHAYTYVQPLPRKIRNRGNKFDENINKRGNVDKGKVELRQDDGPQLNQWLIIFFMIIVVGSSIVPLLNMFGGSGNKPPAE